MTRVSGGNFRLKIDDVEIPAYDVAVTPHYNIAQTICYAVVCFTTTIKALCDISENQAMYIETLGDYPNTITELRDLIVTEWRLDVFDPWGARKAMCRAKVSGKVVDCKISEIEFVHAGTERKRAISALRRLCQKHGDNDWPDDLDLVDVIEKHLARHLDK